MNDGFLLIGAAVLLLGQIICMFFNKLWVRLLPLMIDGVLALFCFAMYAISGFTNWGYLILMMLLLGVAVIIGVIWLLYGFACWLQKAEESVKL